MVVGHNLFSRLREESGQSTIEFGLVVPLLCGLIAALVSFGLGVNQAIDATHLANQGARLAAVNANPADYGAATLKDYILSQATTRVSSVDICAPNATTNVGDPVRVIVHAQLKVIPFINRTFPLKGTATMRLEARPTHYSAGTC